MNSSHEILIVGAGFGGIGVAIGLMKAGFKDFAILEKSNEVGGTWRDHKYPGLTVDITTSLYQYSFEKNPEWTTFFPAAKELFDYTTACAKKYGVYSHTHFGVDITKAVYDEVENLWRVQGRDGRVFVSRYLIAATGFINVVKFPEIKGIETFRGKKLHSSSWDETTRVDGERVGFIGTGATAIQLIPEIAYKVSRLDVYQRTPIWLLPRNERQNSRRFKWVMRNIPGAMTAVRQFHSLIFDYIIIAGLLRYRFFRRFFQGLGRSAIEHIRSQVKDPQLQEKLTPKYTLGCKRLSFSNKYYPVFNEPHVELVTAPIDSITENAIVTTDGQRREIDTLVCATGYDVFGTESTPTFPVYGRKGVELRNFWDQNRFQSYRGLSVAGFPNYFMIAGPYSVAHASYIAMVEDGTRHIIRCLKTAAARRANNIEVKEESMAKDFQACIKGRRNMVFYSANCGASNSYYIDKHGDVPTFRSSHRLAIWLHSHFFNVDGNYHFAQRGSQTLPASPSASRQGEAKSESGRPAHVAASFTESQS